MNLIKNTYTLWLIFILFLAFFEGGFTFIGIQESLTRAIRDILIILLFISSIFFKSKLNIDLNRSYFGKKINSIPIFSKNYIFLYIFILVSIVSSLFNNKTIVEFFLFFRRVFIPILFFFSVFRISFQIKKVINFLIFCVVIQIPFIIIKFFTLGISESGAIGSISIHSGSLSAIFPLSVISFLAAKYIFDTKIKYIIYSCFFILFGLIGGKRVLIAFLPILLLIFARMYEGIVADFSPDKKRRRQAKEAEKMLQCIRVTLLASLHGYAPQLAVEFGRKALHTAERPSFTELEEYVRDAKKGGSA